MKILPYPDKPFKSKEEVKEHVEVLVFNMLNWLKIAEYDFYMCFPGDEDFVEAEGSGASIRVIYPYKRFKLSVQKYTLDQCLNSKQTKAYWRNLEQGLLHECVHVLLWRLCEVGRKRFASETEISEVDESTTDHLTNVVYELITDSRKKK